MSHQKAMTCEYVLNTFYVAPHMFHFIHVGAFLFVLTRHFGPAHNFIHSRINFEVGANTQFKMAPRLHTFQAGNNYSTFTGVRLIL